MSDKDNRNSPQGREKWGGNETTGRSGSDPSGGNQTATDEVTRLLGLSGAHSQTSHFLVETETRVLEVITSPMGRTTVMLRRQEARTFPKTSYADCEKDCDQIRDSIDNLDLKRDSESIIGHVREKVAA